MEGVSASGHTPVPAYTENATSAGVYSVPEGCVMKRVFQVLPSNTEGTLIPRQVNTVIDFILLGICLPVCFVVSFSTNIINMVVFSKHGLKERINMCLFTLSFLDLLYVAVSYGIKSSFPYMFGLGRAEDLGPSDVFFFSSGMIGCLGFGTASQVATVVIALERYLCIAHPLLAKNIMSTRKTALVLWSLIVAITAVCFFTGGLRFGVMCVFDARDSSTYFQLYPKQFFLQNMQLINALGLMSGTILQGLCVACVTVCTIIIVIKMKKLSSWRETVSSASNSHASRDLGVTRMIVATTILFIVCMGPVVTVSVAINLIPDISRGGRYQNLYRVLTSLYLLLPVANSTLNFFVYYTHGSKFRETVRQLFSSSACCGKKTQRELKS